MKRKAIKLKLSLNKKTVANLDTGEMNHLKGGYLTEVGLTCPVTVCPGCLSLNLTQCPEICFPDPPITS
jgi:natural product precursor